MERLLENYHDCLNWRLLLWFGADREVERQGATMTARLGGRRATLDFYPENCRWLLRCQDVELLGSFDRVSKRLRQLFSAPRGEEEAGTITRTANNDGMGVRA